MIYTMADRALSRPMRLLATRREHSPATSLPSICKVVLRSLNSQEEMQLMPESSSGLISTARMRISSQSHCSLWILSTTTIQICSYCFRERALPTVTSRGHSIPDSPSPRTFRGEVVEVSDEAHNSQGRATSTPLYWLLLAVVFYNLWRHDHSQPLCDKRNRRSLQ